LYGSSPRTAQPARLGDHSNHGKIPDSRYNRTAEINVAQADAPGAAVPQIAGDGHDEVRQERRAVDGVADGLLDFSAAW